MTSTNSIKSPKATFCICNSTNVLPSTLDISSEQYLTRSKNNTYCE